MQRALALAASGQGFVEPNPMVGCVIARGAEIIGEGWHRRFGGDHAEVEALRLVGTRAAGADALRHPRTVLSFRQDAPLHAGDRRRGRPPRRCRHARSLPPGRRRRNGGTPRRRCRSRNRPARRRRPAAERPLLETHRSRAAVGRRQVGNDARRQDRHAHRGQPLDHRGAGPAGRPRPARPDGRDCGRPGNGDARRSAVDRPTARSADPLRIVLDTRASLACDRQLVRTAGDSPVLIAAGSEATAADCRRLREVGCEVFRALRGDARRAAGTHSWRSWASGE